MADNRDHCLANKLAGLGIVHPNWTITLSREFNIPLPVAASVLLQESGGGHNIFGYDPFVKPTRILDWLKGRRVTHLRYHYYVANRRAGAGMQGVGPLQLTWWEYQDRADLEGGCDRPYVNLKVGFKLLGEFLAQHPEDQRAGIAAYSGTGAPANDYADAVQRRAAGINDVLTACG